MHRDLIFDAAVLQPSDTATLKKATVEAIGHVSSAGPVSEGDRQRLAESVLRLVRAGYTRTLSGDLDATALAEAAALRFRSMNFRSWAA